MSYHGRHRSRPHRRHKMILVKHSDEGRFYRCRCGRLEWDPVAW